MTMVDADAAKELIGPLNDSLGQAHRAAVANWARFLKDEPELAGPFDAAARAKFINLHVCAEVAKAVAGKPGVTLSDGLGFFGLWIGDHVLLRFKFVGHGAPQNYPTEQQKSLARQEYTPEMMLALAGDSALTPPTLLTCGYTLDGDQIGRIVIRRDCVGHPPWEYDIFGGSALNQPIPISGLKDTAKPARVASKKVRRQEGTGGAEPS